MNCAPVISEDSCWGSDQGQAYRTCRTSTEDRGNSWACLHQECPIDEEVRRKLREQLVEDSDDAHEVDDRDGRGASREPVHDVPVEHDRDHALYSTPKYHDLTDEGSASTTWSGCQHAS